MPARSAQILVAAVLMVGLLVMSALVATYQAHVLFLRARTVVARETVGAITADFNRALAAMLALATRTYFNHTRFAEFTSRFEEFGLEPGDLESAKRVARSYLEGWEAFVRAVYAEKGIQVEWVESVADVSHLLGRPAYVYDLMLLSWYSERAGSYACAVLKLNLTNAGLYGWKVVSLVGLTLFIDAFFSSNDTIRIRVLVDNGTYYGNLLARGWVEVYYQQGGQWVKANVKDMTYEGFGYYRITLESQLPSGAPYIVVASDERGILAVAQSVAPREQGR
uniref:Uncharacterized protein n=1 Tax=Thermofilum pendens TaxID=2269 RepID=A0A7J3X8V1_THEPE